jgi:hypothetical protein
VPDGIHAVKDAGCLIPVHQTRHADVLDVVVVVIRSEIGVVADVRVRQVHIRRVGVFQSGVDLHRLGFAVGASVGRPREGCDQEEQAEQTDLNRRAPEPDRYQQQPGARCRGGANRRRHDSPTAVVTLIVA